MKKFTQNSILITINYPHSIIDLDTNKLVQSLIVYTVSEDTKQHWTGTLQNITVTIMWHTAQSFTPGAFWTREYLPDTERFWVASSSASSSFPSYNYHANDMYQQAAPIEIYV